MWYGLQSFGVDGLATDLAYAVAALLRRLEGTLDGVELVLECADDGQQLLSLVDVSSRVYGVLASADNPLLADLHIAAQSRQLCQRVLPFGEQHVSIQDALVHAHSHPSSSELEERKDLVALQLVDTLQVYELNQEGDADDLRPKPLDQLDGCFCGSPGGDKVVY